MVAKLMLKESANYVLLKQTPIKWKIMPAPIALQLYSVRENLAKDFVKTMEEVADIG